MGYEPGLEFQRIKAGDLISPQSRAVTSAAGGFGLRPQPYISEAELLEAQRPAFERYTEQKRYQDYLTEQNRLNEQAYRMAQRQGKINLGIRGAGLAIQSAPVLKKYGPNVLKTLTRPFQAARPTVTGSGGLFPEAAGTGAGTGATAVTPLAGQGTGLLTATTGPGSVQRFTGLEGGAANLANVGLATGASYLAQRTGLTEGIRDVAGFGGKKEWNIAASSLAAFAFGGPVGLGLNLATEGIKALFK